jgi:hypothetical protein
MLGLLGAPPLLRCHLHGKLRHTVGGHRRASTNCHCLLMSLSGNLPSLEVSQLMRLGKFISVIFLSASMAGCGGGDGPSTPTAPTPPPPAQVAGNWSGTFESNNWAPRAIFMNLTQAGTGVNGTWASSPSEWEGTVTGTVDSGNFSGTFTLSARSNSGGACTGNASVSGPVASGAASLRWTSIGFTGNCTGMPAGVTFAFTRR